MNRNWKTALGVSLICHLGLLCIFRSGFHPPPRRVEPPMIEVMFIVPSDEPVPVELPKPEVSIIPPVEVKPEPVVRPVEPVVPPPLPPKPVEVVQPVVAVPVTPVVAVPVIPPPVAPVVVEPLRPEPPVPIISAPPGVRAHPNYLKNPEPAYPVAARRRKQEGLVLLAVQVTERGRAARVTVKQSSGFPALDDAAVEAVRDWEFQPARIATLPVDSEIEVPVRFQLMR